MIAKMEKMECYQNVDKDVEQLIFSYVAGGSVKYATTLEDYLLKQNVHLPVI